MEAEDLTWHSDHTTQEVLDATIAAATTGATAENPIEIVSDSDQDSDCSSITETEWAEYFAAGDEDYADLDTVAKTRGMDYEHLPVGNVHLLPSIGARPAMIGLTHHLQIRTMTETNKRILYCTKCVQVTEACLTDAQIQMVTFWMMPAMHRSIMSKRQDTMQTMMTNLRMIVRLFMMDASGVDKIGHCLAGESMYPANILSVSRLPYQQDLEHFD